MVLPIAAGTGFGSSPDSLGRGAGIDVVTAPLGRNPAGVLAKPPKLALETTAAGLARKYLSCSHCQEMGQLADPASDWLCVDPIRSQPAIVDTTLDNDYNS